MRSGLCHSLALYDWKTNVSCREFHDIAIEMFRENEIMPNMICNEPPKPKRSITRSYSRGVKKIDEMEGTFYLFHTVEKYAQLIFGWDIKAVKIDTEESKVMTLCFAESLSKLPLKCFIKSIEALTILSEFAYGICYSRPIEQGPDVYAYGIIAGLDRTPEERIERNRITAWLHEEIGERRHLKGYLRDLYPMNILSEKHLDRQVDGKLLTDWITADPSRGLIQKVGIKNWLWTVPDETLPTIRTELRRQGLTIVPPDPEIAH